MNIHLGEIIKLCRKKRGYTQSQLADRAAISVSYLCLLEKNKRDPSLSTAEALSDALRIPFSILVFLSAKSEQLKELSEHQIEKLSRCIEALIDDTSEKAGSF